MSTLTISEAFNRYGAKLKNPQWSVSAWDQYDVLVVCLWQHHYRRAAPGTMEFADTFSRWRGPGNNEFRRNVIRAFGDRRPVRLVVVKAKNAADQALIQSGEEAGPVPKEYEARDDLIGVVLAIDGESYTFRFEKKDVG